VSGGAGSGCLRGCGSGKDLSVLVFWIWREMEERTYATWQANRNTAVWLSALETGGL